MKGRHDGTTGQPDVDSEIRAWYCSRERFRLGVPGMLRMAGVAGVPSDSGALTRNDGLWEFRGRWNRFAIRGCASIELVREKSGHVPMLATAAGVVLFAGTGFRHLEALTPVLLAAVVSMLSSRARWILVQQDEGDDDSRIAYLTTGPFSRYTSAPRRLHEAMKKDLESATMAGGRSPNASPRRSGRG